MAFLNTFRKEEGRDLLKQAGSAAEMRVCLANAVLKKKGAVRFYRICHFATFPLNLGLREISQVSS